MELGLLWVLEAVPGQLMAHEGPGAGLGGG